MAPRSAITPACCLKSCASAHAGDYAHPGAVECCADKNQHRLDEADEKFKVISNAYEVLSDQHERAWCVI